MYRRILVPVDLGDKNVAAVETAVRLVEPEQGRVVLLHVIETIDDVPFEEIKDFYAGLEQKAIEVMQGLVTAVGVEDARVERRVVYGRRVREVLKASTELGVDLIVLHSHRVERGDARTGIGTLSHEIAVLSEIPVLLIK